MFLVRAHRLELLSSFFPEMLSRCDLKELFCDSADSGTASIRKKAAAIINSRLMEKETLDTNSFYAIIPNNYAAA